MNFNIFRSSYKSKTDEDLMILVNKKDSAAFAELYDRYSKILLHFFYKMLAGYEQQAQDFLHDVLGVCSFTLEFSFVESRRLQKLD